VQKITAQGATSSKQQRRTWCRSVRNIGYRWRPESPHYSKQSATCDLVHMPRQLLTRMGSRSDALPDKWPYLSQSTINDVHTMRYIRGAHAHRGRRAQWWQTLQSRLEQYAATGAGTIAEAIVTNDNWWSCQVAHLVPSGGKSTAMKRRYSRCNAVSHTEFIGL
jgi:hypothetical protein